MRSGRTLKDDLVISPFLVEVAAATTKKGPVTADSFRLVVPKVSSASRSCIFRCGRWANMECLWR